MVFPTSMTKSARYYPLWLFLLAFSIRAPLAWADDIRYDSSISIESTLAVGVSNDNSDLARLTLLPSFEAKTRSGWQAQISLRLERFEGDTGLGTLETFDPVSKPWDINDKTFLEVERATLTWRKRSTRITLGKQTFAWGVLDGIQVTDRFDATRKREAIFIEQRPDRIPRWGARAQFRNSGIRWDLGLLVDGTGDQLATLGSTYEVQAPRFRAGVSNNQALPEIDIISSDDMTFGIKGTSRIGKSDISVLLIQGPDPEPLFLFRENVIEALYESRTLLGATFQHAEGSRVWRFEIASINDQSINTSRNSLSIEERSRWLAGIGLDWDLPNNTFLNIQIGIDHISGDQLFRPNKDVISTIKLQKSISNDSLKLSAELIGSLRENDGTFRPAVAWQASDTFYLQCGIDMVWGDTEELIGQFSQTDRVWLKATWEF